MVRVKVAVLVLFFIGVIICIANVRNTLAYPPFLKQTKELGYQAKDCTYCHERNNGGKGWNKRGLWLKEQKKERKAPVVDVKWLKNYTEDAPVDSSTEPKKDDTQPKS